MTGPAWATFAVLPLVVVLTACSAGGSSTNAGDEAVQQFSPPSREPVDRVTGELLDGGSFDSRDLDGSVVVYNVWGSWCGPCRREAPALKRISTEMQESGVRFVGINVRDNDQAARAFEENYGIPYPSITTDSSSAALLAFGSALPASAVPSTLIVDAEGRLAARVIGAASYTTLRALVTDVLAKPEPAK